MILLLFRIDSIFNLIRSWRQWQRNNLHPQDASHTFAKLEQSDKLVVVQMWIYVTLANQKRKVNNFMLLKAVGHPRTSKSVWARKHNERQDFIHKHKFLWDVWFELLFLRLWSISLLPGLCSVCLSSVVYEYISVNYRQHFSQTALISDIQVQHILVCWMNFPFKRLTIIYLIFLVYATYTFCYALLLHWIQIFRFRVLFFRKKKSFFLRRNFLFTSKCFYKCERIYIVEMNRIFYTISTAKIITIIKIYISLGTFFFSFWIRNKKAPPVLSKF